MKTFLRRITIYTSVSVVVLFICFVGSAHSSVNESSQVSGATEITSLSEAITIALANNPGIQAAKSNWESVQQEIKVAGAWPEPTLSFTQFVEPVQTRNGPQHQQIAINQMIPIWGTTGLKKTITNQRTEKARQEYLSAYQSVIAQVKRTWADLYWVDASLQALNEYQNLVRTFQDIAQTRYATGSGLQAAVLKSQVEISNLDERIIKFSEMRATFLHSLNGILNRPIDSAIAPIDTIQLPEYSIQEKELMSLMAEHRQDLQGLRAMIQASRERVSLTRRLNLPSLGIGMNYITVGNELGGMDPGKDAVAVMAKIDLPLWFGSNKAQTQQARLGVASAQFRYADQRNRAEAEVRSLHFKIQQSQKSLTLYRDRLIPQADQTLQSTLSAYQTGQIGFLDLLDSERMIVQFKLNYYKEQSTYLQRIADLEKAVGTELNLDGE